MFHPTSFVTWFFSPKLFKQNRSGLTSRHRRPVLFRSIPCFYCSSFQKIEAQTKNTVFQVRVLLYFVYCFPDFIDFQYSGWGERDMGLCDKVLCSWEASTVAQPHCPPKGEIMALGFATWAKPDRSWCLFIASAPIFFFCSKGVWTSLLDPWTWGRLSSPQVII